jgi:hypothetical protein
VLGLYTAWALRFSAKKASKSEYTFGSSVGVLTTGAAAAAATAPDYEVQTLGATAVCMHAC